MEKSPSRNRTIRLKDGRTLGYAEFGAPGDRPIFLFHGNPGSRLDATLGAVEQPGIRVIAPDRPGVGLSDMQVKPFS
ncbi:MAG: alpha/beta hydrolase [Chloroflexi bacterium]|nr:alpha/beta hydrolase [Chloroflexota bacterium]